MGVGKHKNEKAKKLKQTIGFEIGIFVQNNGKKRFVSKHRVSKHFRQHGHTVIQNMVFFLRDAKCMKLFCRVGFPNIDLHLCVRVHSNITKTNMYYIHGNLAMDMQCLSLYYIYTYHICIQYDICIYIYIYTLKLYSWHPQIPAEPQPQV